MSLSPILSQTTFFSRSVIHTIKICQQNYLVKLKKELFSHKYIHKEKLLSSENPHVNNRILSTEYIKHSNSIHRPPSKRRLTRIPSLKYTLKNRIRKFRNTAKDHIN